MEPWSPAGWRGFEARQQPRYHGARALAAACRLLARRPALAKPRDCDALRKRLAEAQVGRAFLVQGGDCAERFAQFSPAAVASDLDLLDAAAARIEAAIARPAIRLGRIAGQFAKPRSFAAEERDGLVLPPWRGDIVNGLAFTPAARSADPARMLRAYAQSAATMAVLERHAGRISCSHEALLLAFEEALVRRDPESGRFYSGSAHFLWIGHRTCFEGSAHVELLRGLANPIGLKCGPGLAPDSLLRLLDRLDPGREPGRITLIVRLGAGRIAAELPALVRAVRAAGRPALWACDPMHGNTDRPPGGGKARELGAIEAELDSFFAILVAEGARAGGIHLEMTARGVRECGAQVPSGPDACQSDPRLNAAQAFALADRAATLATARAPEPRGEPPNPVPRREAVG